MAIGIRPGMVIDAEGVIFRIVDIHSMGQVAGKQTYVVAYSIQDGDYISPVGHFMISSGDNPRDKIVQIVEWYLQNKTYVQQVTRVARSR